MQLLLMELGKKFLEVRMFVKETYEQWVKTIPPHTSFYGGEIQKQTRLYRDYLKQAHYKDPILNPTVWL